MLKLMIECPRSGRLIATGIEVDPVTFHGLGNFEAKTFCPYCNRHHRWSKKEVCLERAYSNPPLALAVSTSFEKSSLGLVADL